MGQWGKLYIEGGWRVGKRFTVYHDDVQMKAMEAAVSVDIQTFEFKVCDHACPLWRKIPDRRLLEPLRDLSQRPDAEMGRFAANGLETDTEGFIFFMAHVMGWLQVEIQVNITHLRRELRSGKMHGYYAQRLFSGRNPK